MGLFFSTLSNSDAGKPNPLPPTKQIRCEVLSLYDSVIDETRQLLSQSRILLGPGPSLDSESHLHLSSTVTGPDSETPDSNGLNHQISGTSASPYRESALTQSFDSALASCSTRTLRRSEVTSDTQLEKLFNEYNNTSSNSNTVTKSKGGKGTSATPHLMFICHKCSGQRTPLLGSSGLYTKFLKKALHSLGCEIIFLILDVPSVEYFHQLLSEQKELNIMFLCNRVLPVFQNMSKMYNNNNSSSNSNSNSTPSDSCNEKSGRLSTGTNSTMSSDHNVNPSSGSETESKNTSSEFVITKATDSSLNNLVSLSANVPYWEDQISDIVCGRLPPFRDLYDTNGNTENPIIFQPNWSETEFVRTIYGG